MPERFNDWNIITKICFIKKISTQWQRYVNPTAEVGVTEKPHGYSSPNAQELNAQAENAGEI